jgi:hypothetical protein
MKKYDPLAKPKTLEKILIILLVIATSATACFVVPLVQEVVSGIRYAPIDQFYIIFGVCLLWNLPIAFYLLYRTWQSQTNRTLALRMIVAMLMPVALSTLPHQVNKWAAHAEVQHITLPVVGKSRQMRYPRGGDAFIVYRLHFHFDNIPIGGKILNGEHTVFVTSETYAETKKGDLFPLALQSGPIAVFMLKNDTMINLMR